MEQIASELRKIASIIGEIRLEEKPSDFFLARTLLDSVDGSAYAMARALLEEKDDLTMLMVIEKFKEVEQKNKDNEVNIHEVANRASSDRKFSGKCYHCDKVGHIKTSCFLWLKTDEGQKHQKGSENTDHMSNKTRGKSSNGGRGRKPKKSEEARLTREDEDDARSEASDASEYARMAVEDAEEYIQAAQFEAQEEYALAATARMGAGSEAQAARFGAIAQTGAGTPSKEWIIDSGASRHMTPDRGLFVSMMLIRTTVRVADGTVILSIGRGDVLVRMRNGEKIRLTEVLFVPELDTNLLSIRALQAKGISVRFGLNGVEITRGEALLATGVLSGSSYLLRPAREDVALITEVTKEKHSPNPARDDYLLWHARMGHVSLKRLEKLPSLTTGTGAIKGVDATAHSDKCVTCKYTKMTKVISRMPPLKSTRRGERTFSDYWGPYKVANLQGSQYFLSFVDDFSRRSEVYFGSRLTLKENFQRYKAKFEVETGEKLGLIRTDNAKEYHALEKDLLKEGIQMEFTDPYTPEQNGVAERLNRTLMQMVRAMQLWAGLPREFWGEALMVANYLRNRLPTNTHGGKMTPYEAWYGRRPDLGHLRTYGCLVHARIPSERRDKMDVVSFQGVFVGYHSSKQYRIYNPKTKKIGWHSSLDFFEDWPGGPLLNVPTESGTWEIDTIDSDYEPDKYLDNQLITNEGGDEVIGDNGQNKNLSVGADPTSQIENPEEITSPVGADPASSNEGIPTIELNAQSNTGIPATIEGKSPRKRTPTTTAFTRSKRERKPYDKYAFDNNQALQTNDDHDPTSYSEAVNGKDWRKWKIAIKEELDALLSNGTFLVVNQPSNRDLITSKWVFKVKRHANGMIDRYKARLVARGFSQKYGIDYNETFAPTLRCETLRILFGIAAELDLEIQQADVSNAYLIGELTEEIYMEIPEGLEVKGHEKAILLKKGLYGLKQSGRIWNQRFKKFVISIGFNVIPADNCVFYHPVSKVIIAIYVDDILYFGQQNSDIKAVKILISEEFKVRNMGEPRSILGIRITRDRAKRTITMDQTAYIERFLRDYQMDQCRPVSTPIEGHLSSANEKDVRTNQLEYQRRIGSLMYAMTATRPDLAYCVGKLSQHSHDPTESHRSALDRVFRYLKATSKLGLIFDGSSEVIAFADSDYANEKADRKSTHGMVMKIFGGACIWRSAKQRSTSSSSTEAEYVSMCEAGKQLVWASRLMSQLHLRPNKAIDLKGDNQGCLALIKNPEHHSRTKHIDVQYHYIREIVDDGLIRISYVPTAEMLADIFTKPLPQASFERLRASLGVRIVS